jgi:hypothetical protein
MGGIADDQLVHGAQDHIDDAIGDVFLHEQPAQRRVALASAHESGLDDVVHHLYGGAVESTIMAFKPPISTIRDRVAPVCAAGVRLMASAVAFEPVHGDAAKPWIAKREFAEYPTGGGNQVQYLAWNSGLIQQPHERGGNERDGFGGLDDDGIAGHQCGRQLASENRQRKFQRLMQANTPRLSIESSFTSPVGPSSRLDENCSAAHKAWYWQKSTVSHRIAHFRDSVGKRLADFANQQTVKFKPPLLE